MNRRGFLKAMIGIGASAVALPLLSASEAVAAPKIDTGNPLFSGRLGRYENFRIIEAAEESPVLARLIVRSVDMGKRFDVGSVKEYMHVFDMQMMAREGKKGEVLFNSEDITFVSEVDQTITSISVDIDMSALSHGLFSGRREIPLAIRAPVHAGAGSNVTVQFADDSMLSVA